ncbi:hypothetical protein D7147_04880 [Micromonospora musae]|uniref:Thiamine pyrophosphate enzyme N-terminal TPP-binding domain-containing protein n=1 Tax=Micromonospora musae TaxID=1894970 RepID=A0ABX9REC7_9ACTN|nr:hypothetical protein D7147_04880 [Micromonospora musae]
MFCVQSFVFDGGDYLGAAHEAGAMFMRFGYPSRTGGLGVVTVTHGPALTNTLTGLVKGPPAAELTSRTSRSVTLCCPPAQGSSRRGHLRAR